ncbi:hypothetical protein [Maribellus sediminis]|uniref:hypothetical protein n=1 Tax=Maribellus sediminis TaxID=2696285 RepID=UPI00142FF1C8|nr:hypothetical protein [Maribellus sediminis]
MENKSKSSRIWLFRIILVSLSLFLIVFIELILRLAGYGHSYDLFVESESYPGYYVMNEFASEKFFPDADKATVGYYEPFAMHKADDTYRIFVLGESTTVGFPYGYNGSFHRWLKYRLMFTFPDVNFEIINLSLTAVNSYTVADFAEKIVDYEPDAVLIYVGHNEYYGALGVGSVLKTGNNPKIVRSIIKLRQLKLYQLMYNIIEGISKATQTEKLTEESLMQHMPGDKQIAFGSEKYQQAIEQFRYNMNRTCEILDSESIPVLISNLVSNEKDLKPFISDSVPENSAIIFYEKARQQYENGNFNEAKKLFVKAKEYDLLRFRAPEAINSEIETLARSYDLVHFVDSRSRFEQGSPHGIIGNETLLEHVHPNLFGYALLSDAFFTKMKELDLPASDWSRAMSFDRLLKEMPVNEVDSLKGAYQIRFMLNEWPFTNNPVPKQQVVKATTEFEKSILNYTLGETSWNKVQAGLYVAYRDKGDVKSALKISEAFALIDPLEEKLLKDVAALSVSADDLPKAAFYFSKAFKLNPTISVAQQLGKIYTRTDDPEHALLYYRYLQSNDTKNTFYGVIITILEDIQREKEALIENDANIQVLNKLAFDYVQLRNTEPARKYILRSLSLDSRNKETIQIAQALLQVEKEQKEQ